MVCSMKPLIFTVSTARGPNANLGKQALGGNFATWSLTQVRWHAFLGSATHHEMPHPKVLEQVPKRLLLTGTRLVPLKNDKTS